MGLPMGEQRSGVPCWPDVPAINDWDTAPTRVAVKLMRRSKGSAAAEEGQLCWHLEVVIEYSN